MLVRYEKMNAVLPGRPVDKKLQIASVGHGARELNRSVADEFDS